MLDVDFVRAQFPGLETPWAFFDNAGGSFVPRQVSARVREHLERRPVQLGASYELSREAGAAVDAGRRAAATLIGAPVGECVLGPSASMLLLLLARALRPCWRAGDEVVVTELDHEANVGPWRKLEASGIVVREWRMDPETCALRLADLEPLLNERTRLVAFTQKLPL
jgi:selenocysteine lyase/cysteine desulfurase